MATTVHVKNIGGKTEDKEIRDFFSFCGKITDISITNEGETRNATVSFEKDTAARTALLLNHTQLGGREISVSSEGATTPTHEEGESGTAAERGPDEGLRQEEKPRSRILAELLAHGYVVADAGLQKAIALDEKHGVTNRFVATLKQLDERTRATDHARAADASYGISQRASSLLTGLNSYFERASNTPTGKRLVDFYTTSQRQVQDIHNEARRLANLKKEEAGGNLYKAVGLDKVFDRFGQGGSQAQSAPAQGQGEKGATHQPPGAAPANAAATETRNPTAESGTNPETIH